MSSLLFQPSSIGYQKGNRNKRYIQSSSSYINLLCSFEKTVRHSLLMKYNSTPISYNKNIINNIIYNEKTRVVALFKDYLITDDSSEFLKRYYTRKESGVRLPKFFEYYETYSKLFPNYTALIEGKYIYKNIQKKQRMIDLQERMELEEKNKKKNKTKNINNKSNEVFSTDVYDSIINDRDTEEIEILFNIQINEIENEEKTFIKCIDRIVSEIEKYDDKPIIQHNELLTSRTVRKPNYSKFLSKQNSNIINVINDTEDNKEEENINDVNPKTERTLIERIELNLLRINKKKQHTNSISTTKTIKPKLSDLRLLYQKNIKVNPSSNIPLTYRGNSLANETAKSSKSPLTDRTYKKTIHKSTSSNIVNTNTSTAHNVNNIIYIINQNPTFTTNVNVFNTTAKATRKVISSMQSRSNSKKSSSINRKTVSQNIPIHFSKTITNKTLTKKNTNVHKRNISNFINNNGLKTARDIGYKELNILKAAAQKNNHKEEAYTSRYNYKYSNYLKNKNDIQKISRNVRNSSNEKSTQSNNKNYISRNDSLTKLGFMDAITIKKKIKGIQIKNFSKIFNVNLSQIQSKTDRYNK